MPKENLPIDDFSLLQEAFHILIFYLCSHPIITQKYIVHIMDGNRQREF
jgi:hypothetical protein